MGVLTDIKARGVEDILITSTDILNGFTDTIRTVFSEAATQVCVVHQIRNSCRYVTYKDLKEFTKDLKTIYGTVNKDAANLALDTFEQKWGMLSEAGKQTGMILPPFLTIPWRSER
jgi:transposase-like protein